MSADWYPDPLRRAHLRFYDGTSWTRHVATNGQQSVEPDELALTHPVGALTPLAPQSPHSYFPQYPPIPPYAAPPGGSGRLIAAGVLAIISGAVTTLIGVLLLVVANDSTLFDDCGGGPTCPPDVVNHSILGTVGVLVLVAGAMFVVAGIGGCMRKRWGQIMIILLGSLAALLYVVGMAVRGLPGTVLPVIWFSAVTGLAVGINRAVFERPDH